MGRPPSDNPKRLRPVRITDELWECVLAAAQAEGVSAAEWVRCAVEERLRGKANPVASGFPGRDVPTR